MLRVLITPGDENLYGTDIKIIERHWHSHSKKTMLDVGCGPGTWSLVAMAGGAKVIAFDPKPLAKELLDRQALLNGFTNYVFVLAGVWSESGTLPFGSNSYVQGESISTTPVVSLDDYCLPTEVRIDDINIDAEWAEVQIIKGARKLLARDHPKLIIEVHDEEYDPELRREILAGWSGYRISREAGFMIAE